MIPIIALMLALYGSARLANDVGRQYPGSDLARRLSWVVFVFTFLGLWFLAFCVVITGAGVDLSRLK